MFQPISQYLNARYGNLKPPPVPHKAAHCPRLRAEVNSLLYPFFFLGKGKPPQVIECRIARRRGGQSLEAVWRVIPHPAYGHPGPLAHRVHRAVEQLITERGLPVENPVPFSIHDLCRRLGMRAGGTEYRKVRQALVAIKATQVESKGAFYAKVDARYIDQVFSLYDRVVFAGERLPDGTVAEQSLLYLGTWYLESLNALYVRPLDYRVYRGLHTPIARRLYELLGVKFYRVAGQPDPWIRYRYSTLCRLLPVRHHRYRSRMRQQLGPAHRELTEVGFLLEARDRPISHGRDENDWYLIYRPGPKALEEIRRPKATQ